MALARSPTTFGADCCAWALGREALTKWRRRRDEQDHPYWLTDPYGLKIVLLKKGLLKRFVKKICSENRARKAGFGKQGSKRKQANDDRFFIH